MKRKLFFNRFSLTVLLLIGCVLFTQAQDSSQHKSVTKKPTVKEMLDSRQFVFRAQNANPLRGQSRVLTTVYEFSLEGDSIQCNLPYYGRVYSPPIDPSKNVLEFVSTRFTYVVVPLKRGRWQVTIQLKDNRSVQQLFFTFFDNGSVSLSVNFSSRDAITFNGIIQPVNKGR